MRDSLGRFVKGHTKINSKVSKSILVNCEECGVEIKKYFSTLTNHNFCSNKCSGRWKSNNKIFKGLRSELAKSQWANPTVRDKMIVSLKGRTGEKAPNWQGGVSFEDYGKDFNKSLKEQIRERDNHTCQECGYTEDQLGYKLPVHHIDYNKKNNDPLNLISLCRSCHNQTGYGRADWTVYYKNKIGEVLNADILMEM